MPIQDLATVDISLSSPALTAPGFGVPMILGTHTRFVDRFRVYTSLAGMLADGFTIGDPEYLQAQALLAQRRRVPRFVVGRRAVTVAEVTRITITTAAAGVWSVEIGGPLGSVTATYTAGGGDDTAAIRNALTTAIQALADRAANAANQGLANIDLTGRQAGVPFTVAVTAPAGGASTITETTASTGIVDDLNAIEAAGAAWYCTLLTSRDNEDILLAAEWTETRRKILIAQASEAATADSVFSEGGTDIGSRLRALARSRTALVFHLRDAEYVDAALAGRVLPLTPGTETWSAKQLRGVTASALTDTQLANLRGAPAQGPGGKRVNVYLAVSDGVAATSQGTMSSGEWIDVIRYIDSLQARLEVGVVNLQLDNDRIPMTDEGIAQVASIVKTELAADATAGILSPVLDARGRVEIEAFTVTSPASGDISSADRAARRLNPPIRFTARYAGAIHHSNITGTVAQ